MDHDAETNSIKAAPENVFPGAGRNRFLKKRRRREAANTGGKPVRGRSKAGWRLAAFCGLLALAPRAPAAPLMEEGFNYPAGTSLAANPPWSGAAGSSVAVAGGNLMLTNLQPILPAGNLLQIGGGSALAYRNFSASPVLSAQGTAVYCSALVSCTQSPTNRQFIAALLAAGSTSATPPNDPVDLYLTPASGGCRLAIGTGGFGIAAASAVLAVNTTHLIVLKYTFGTNEIASLYVDPVPGAPEPAAPNAQPGGDDGDDDGTGSTSTDANLQVLLFQSPSAAAPGGVKIDTVRVGTNWADVTPKVLPVSANGPQDMAVCSGSSATFSVTANGTPPFTYQWRTNGLPVGGATNNIYLLPSPGAADTAVAYDVVVHDFFGAVTSRVASLLISHSPPVIPFPPTNQVIFPGTSNAVFSVGAAGDAPLSYQWFTNGVAVPGATNASYTVANPGPAEATNPIVVVVSNPCGSIASAPAAVVFPTIFYSVADAGAGFFSGENVIFTNTSGINYYVWSSSSLAVSVTNWTLEGQMSELPLGTSGNSRYGYNVNPATSPTYYIFARTNTGPFMPTEALACLTTPDFATFYVNAGVMAITADGFFASSGLPDIVQQPLSQTVLAGQSAVFNVMATGLGLGYQWLSNNSGISGATAPALNLAGVSPANAGSYAVVVSNSSGSVTSSVATLTVVLPPAFNVNLAAGTLQLSAVTATGLTYVVQSATDLASPNWTPVLTNNTGGSGAVNFQTNLTSGPMQFYRLVFP